jgi:hypothetical protein
VAQRRLERDRDRCRPDVGYPHAPQTCREGGIISAPRSHEGFI